MKIKSKLLMLSMVLFFLVNIPLVLSATDSDLSNNNKSIQVNVIKTKSLIIDFVPVDYYKSMNYYEADITDNLELLEKVYPLGDNKVNARITFKVFNSSEKAPVYNVTSIDETCHLIALLFKSRRLLGKFELYDRVVGVVPTGWFAQRNVPQAGGVSCGLGTNKSLMAVLVEEGHRFSVAHELAHTYGLCEEYRNSSWVSNDLFLKAVTKKGCPNGDLDGDGNLDSVCLQEYAGCPTSTLDIIFSASDPPYTPVYQNGEIELRNFMGFEFRDKWIDNLSYNHLLNRLSTNWTLLDVIKSVIISGSINKNGTVVFDEFYTLNETEILDVTETEGNYTLILEINGSEFYSTKLEPDFHVYGIGGDTIETNISYFAFVVPFNDSVTKIILQNTTTILVEKNVSLNEPIVSFTTSFENQIYDDDFIVNWSASDVDGDNLTYSILISGDSGANFTTLALDIDDTSLIVENSLLENGSEFKLKVLATDGVRTTEDISNSTFSIEPDPIVELVAPDGDTRLSTNDVTFLYRTAVLDANITNCSLFINDILNLTNSSEIIQNEVMNFTQTLTDGDYNWTIECADTREFIGESELRSLTISLVIPEIANVTAYPNPQGFGENVTIEAVLSDPDSVDTVTLNVTNPKGSESSYILNNISANVWKLANFTDYVNGTYNFTFFVNHSGGGSVEESGNFDMFITLFTQIHTLKDSYNNNSLVNVTDPPDGNSLIKRGATWEDVDLGDGKHNLILYSGTRFGFEDGRWKPIEELRSFVGSTNIKCVVDSDSIHLTECLDFNYTHRKIKINLNEKFIESVKDKKGKRSRKERIANNVNKNSIPIKVISKRWGELLQEDVEVVKSSLTEDFSVEKIKEEWIEADFEDIIKIGEESTTIQLQDADSENLDDASVVGGSPDYADGARNYMYIGTNKSGTYSGSYDAEDTRVNVTKLVLDREHDVLNHTQIKVTIEDCLSATTITAKVWTGNSPTTLWAIGESKSCNSGSELTLELGYEVNTSSTNWVGIEADSNITMSVDTTGESRDWYYDNSDGWTSYPDVAFRLNIPFFIGDQYSLITFNTATISWKVVDDAVLALHSPYKFYTVNASIYKINQSWNEETVTYNTKPTDTGVIIDSSNISSYAYNFFNVTEAIDTSEDDVSFYIKRNDIGSSSGSYAFLRTKEYGISSYRPYLNITYEEEIEDNESKIRNDASINTSIYLLMKVQYWNGSAWLDEALIQNDTSPTRIQPGSGNQLKLDAIWNLNAWNTSTNTYGFGTYRVYVAVTDENDVILQNEDGTEIVASYNFSLSFLPQDQNKFYIKNSTGSAVAWFGDLGNIVLKGSCASGGTCNAPDNSFIIRNSTDDTVAYVDSQGNLCVEKGDCSDQSAACNPTRDAFIIQNSSGYNVIYIDSDGDLCLIGTLIENGNP